MRVKQEKIDPYPFQVGIFADYKGVYVKIAISVRAYGDF
jgi:hypothetical protein